MRAVIQRVTEARVRVGGEVIGEIGPGLLVLLCVMEGDTDEDLDWIVRKTVGMRVFPDETGKFDRAVADIGGEILLVSQFTLAARVKKGRRPDFTQAAAPGIAEATCQAAATRFRDHGLTVAEGSFGAMMAVELVNDGPVTIPIDSRER